MRGIFGRRGRQWGDDPVLLKMIDAIGVAIAESLSDPLDEIRGHLTASTLRDWIKSNIRAVDAQNCVLYHDHKKRTVAAFLVAEDGTFLFDRSGRRVAVAFSAVTVDNEIADLLSQDSVIVLDLRNNRGFV